MRQLSPSGVAWHHLWGRVYRLEPGRLGVDSERLGFVATRLYGGETGLYAAIDAAVVLAALAQAGN